MQALRATWLLTAVVLFGTLPCRADLVGTQVTGSLTFAGSTSPNYFDPSILGGLLVPSADLNSQGPTVTISATGVEFGYTDGSSAITADFTGTQLTLTDSTSSSSSWAISFTDTSFAGLSLASNLGFTGLTYGSSGDMLTFNWTGVASQSQSHKYSAVFNIVDPPPPTAPQGTLPEPTAVVSLGAGLGVVGLMALKRKRVA